jgi:2-polyprenyl-3-methyl-5-hydroxy-6-metoxy-1,4-benzoquinol methylase
MSEDLESASGGWDQSAAAWIAELGDVGDFGRRFVLDAPMLAHVRGHGFRNALDVGCGEGRFCRMMRAEGIATTGIDPTAALVQHARSLDPSGDYRIERAETFDLGEGAFDLVVSYLTLIDIDDLDGSVRNMARALRPGGVVLVANLTSFVTAGMPEGWRDRGGVIHFSIDHYLEQRPIWVEWNRIRIRNWHRPLETYMHAFLNAGLILRDLTEPAPSGGDPQKAERYRRVPWFHIMEWQKP